MYCSGNTACSNSFNCPDINHRNDVSWLSTVYKWGHQDVATLSHKSGKRQDLNRGSPISEPSCCLLSYVLDCQRKPGFGLKQQFPTSEVYSPKGHLKTSGDLFASGGGRVGVKRWYVIGISWGEAREAAKHTILQHTDQPPTMKNYPAPHINNTFSNSHLK